MDSTIAAVLLLDGIGNGAVYALLGMAIVLVFAVTRVILIPQDRKSTRLNSSHVD